MAGRRRTFYERLASEPVRSYYTNNLTHLQYLTGFRGTAGSLLLVEDRPGASVLFVDGRYRNYAEGMEADDLEVREVSGSRFEALNEYLVDRGIDSVHFEKNNLLYAEFREVVDNVTHPGERQYGEDWVLEQRTRKEPGEIQAMQEAIDQTLELFDLLETWVEPGLSERDLSRALRRELESRGEGLAFDPLVLTGENTANPHCPSGDRELEEDDVLLVDMGLKRGGYCSDVTRMFFLGEPPDPLPGLYELSKRAAARAFERLRPGVEIGTVARAAHELIEEEGHGENLRHGLGHGVGLDVHEPPSLSDRTGGTLEPGTVVTLEPGIYIDGLGGGRVEHMAYVTEDGARILDEPDDVLEQVIDDHGHDE